MGREGRVGLLRGAHVSLREMDEDDTERVVAWRNGPESRKWLIQWEPLTVQAHLEWFRAAKQRGDLLIMFDTLGGQPVATGSVYDFDRPKTSARWGRLCGAQVGRHPHSILEAFYLVSLRPRSASIFTTSPGRAFRKVRRVLNRTAFLWLFTRASQSVMFDRDETVRLDSMKFLRLSGRPRHANIYGFNWA